MEKLDYAFMCACTRTSCLMKKKTSLHVGERTQYVRIYESERKPCHNYKVSMIPVIHNSRSRFLLDRHGQIQYTYIRVRLCIILQTHNAFTVVYYCCMVLLLSLRQSAFSPSPYIYSYGYVRPRNSVMARFLHPSIPAIYQPSRHENRERKKETTGIKMTRRVDE